MNYFEEDSIITEVRKNRAELLTEFNGDTKKLIEYLISQESAMEAAGWRYETEAEFEARKTLHRQKQETECNRIESLLNKSLA
ncbi:MAG: hypothetical protein LBV07_00095 [Syntrophobacterales bacterium]|jgi:hypothetical protein|nr:hypothetical protein [Syntrophobacterales bacterium]